jgi:hypothetical protein
LSDKTHLLLNRLDQLKDELYREMFNESLLKFEYRILLDSSAVGKLVYKNIEFCFFENFENMRELMVASKIKNTSYSHIYNHSNQIVFCFCIGKVIF